MDVTKSRAASLSAVQPLKHDDPTAVKAAREFERYFLDEMMKSMRSTVSTSDLTKPSMAEKIYREQLDQRYVESWSENGGVGLANLILEAIRGRSGDALPVGQPDLGGAKEARRVQSGAQVAFELIGGQGPVAPWAGSIQSVGRDEDRAIVQIDHGKGFRSAIAFRGQPSPEVRVGSEVNSGRALGGLSPGNPSVFINLQRHPQGLGGAE